MDHRIYAINTYKNNGDKISEVIRVYTPKMCAAVIAAYARKGIETIVDYGGTKPCFNSSIGDAPFAWRFHAYGRVQHYRMTKHDDFLYEAVIALSRH